MSVDVELVNAMSSTKHHSNKWPLILDQLYPIGSADYSGLAVIEKQSNSAAGLFHTFSTTSTNVDPEVEATYLAEYSHHEMKHVQLTMNAPVGEMVVDPDFDDYEEITQRADVKYAMKHLNIFHRVGIRLNNEHSYTDVIALQLRADRRDNFTREAIAPVLLYVPHMAQAINMGRFYDAIRKRYTAVLSMLDRVNVGMVLMSNKGAIVVANTYAKEIIEGSSRLKITKSGYLQVTDPLMDRYLKSRVEALQVSADRAEKYIVRLGNDADSSDLVLELSPLLDADADIDAGFLGVMAIIVDPNRPFLASHQSIATVFSLTKAESAVAHLIANGNNYNDVAKERGVSRETIKTQAGKLMHKMNVKTRAGVIRKLMTLGIPFNDSGT